MDFERLIQHTLALQAIPAPTFSESRRADYLRLAFSDVGLDRPQIDAVGNLKVKIRGGERDPLILCAHMDHVFEETPLPQAQRVSGKIIGPGVGDNAVALATLIEIAHEFIHHPLPGDLWLVGTVGEEGLGNLHGMREIVSHFGSQVTGYIALEGIGLGQIYHQGLPAERYRVTVQTQGGHSWIHADRPSAVHILLSIGAQLLKIPLSESPRTTLNIGLISGGRSVNSIANEASMALDVRSLDAETLASTSRQIKKIIREMQSPDCSIQIELTGARPGGALGSEHALVAAAQQALNEAGEEGISLAAGSTDANLPLSEGIPAICLGLTYGGEAHSEGEYIEIAPLERGVQALKNLIRLAFG
jgi:acetylornithine deacetylase/succinyl-diaminopimelate desuccinylase-like protein